MRKKAGQYLIFHLGWCCRVWQQWEWRTCWSVPSCIVCVAVCCCVLLCAAPACSEWCFGSSYLSSCIDSSCPDVCVNSLQDSGRDAGSEFIREKGLLGCQGPAVEMSGWQGGQSCSLPELPERIWGKVPCTVGKWSPSLLPFMNCKILGFTFRRWCWEQSLKHLEICLIREQILSKTELQVYRRTHLLCFSRQVKYFAKRRDYLKYKEKMENEGFTPAKGPKQPS